MSAFNELMSIRSLPHPVAEEVHISGADPVLETHLRLLKPQHRCWQVLAWR